MDSIPVWEQLASQAPVVVIFAIAVWLLVDRFLKAMDKRDSAYLEALKELTKSLNAHDTFVREHSRRRRKDEG